MSSATKRGGRYFPCTYCGKDVWVMPSRAMFVDHFCSREHMIKNAKEAAFSFPCEVCGDEVKVQPVQMKVRNRQTCSQKCKAVLTREKTKRAREARGVTEKEQSRLDRRSPEAAAWRKEVFARDDYTCQMCGTRGGYLEADHIKPWSYFPGLRYEVSNGRTLCRPCHDTTKVSAAKMALLYA